MENQYLSSVVDLTHPENNLIFNMDNDTAREILESGNVEEVRKIDGHFALVSVQGKTVRMARSIARPIRYFIAKLTEGPCLVIAERIDAIYNYLKKEGLDHQFHPSYTRMAPAHYITTIELLGCPDPNPAYSRFFTPERNKYRGTDTKEIGAIYIRAVYDEILKWLRHRATIGPIGVSFSAGVDSGAIFLLTYHALLSLGESPSRLKAFTLSVDGNGSDLKQAREFLEALDLGLFLEPVDIDSSQLNWRETIAVVEDYKPLDIQSATMNFALLKEIRNRYPDWRYMIDGDGGDENLKDYPIEDNPELTIKSVLNNLMLYQEGWGVDTMKHSLTYSGGLSRAYTRTYAPCDRLGFDGFSPFTLPEVIEISEGIPFVEMTDWDHEKLYRLKGEIVAAGVAAVTGMKMPINTKKRFQQGAAGKNLGHHFPQNDIDYRNAFYSTYEQIPSI